VHLLVRTTSIAKKSGTLQAFRRRI
jgi:hypothetical protein